MAATYRQPVDDDVPWEQRLANYASNKDAGLSEYQRALEVYRGKSAAGDTAGAEAAKKWSEQVNTAIGGIGNTRSAQATNALDKVGATVNAQPFQFKQTVAAYNPNNIQSDPAYQAALRQAQQGAQTATNNAMVSLGSRGIGNSSVAVDRANQIQQQAIGNVNDTILPQLMQQAYARYQDEVNNDYRTQLANYQAQQDQIKNLTGYAGTLSDLDQRDADNAYRTGQAAEAQKQNNWNAYLQSVGLTGDLGTGPKSDYSLLGAKSGNLSFSGQQYADNQKQQQFDNNLKVQQLDQAAKQFAASQGLDWARLNQQQQQFVAEQAMKQLQLAAANDPNNLDNQYKKAQIDALKGKNAQTANHGIDEYDLAMIDTLASQKGLDLSKPTSIRPFVADLKSQYGWTTDEAQKVESYLNNKASSASAGSGGSGFFPSFNLDSISKNAQGGLNLLNNILPGGSNNNESSQSYLEYLKQLAKDYNPMNAFR